MSPYSLIDIPPYKFILPIRSLREVLVNTEIMPIPTAPKYIKGITPIRSALCTVLDLPSLLGFSSEMKTPTRLIVIDHSMGFFALEADSVDIISVTNILPKPTNIVFSQWISGVVSSESLGTIFLLDFTALEHMAFP